MADQHDGLDRAVPGKHWGKDEPMDPRLVATCKVLVEQGWKGEAGTRDYTAAELDAIAAFAWPWEGLQRVVIAGVHAIQGRWGHLSGRGHVSLARPRSPQMREV